MRKIGDEKSIFNVLLGLEPQYILILPHVRTDPDALGCSAGLADFLQQLSHRVEVIVDEQPDEKLQYIYADTPLTVFSQDSLVKTANPDLIIYVDHHSENRLAKRLHILEKHPTTPLIIIDHHLIQTETPEAFYDLAEFQNRNVFAWIDSDRSSVSEMIAELFLLGLSKNIMPHHLKADKQHCRLAITRQVSISLLAGIYGDTGGLRYSNTTARSFFICSQLMRSDIAIDKIANPIFADKSLNQVRLLAKIFENAELNDQGNMIWYGVSRKFLEENKGTQDDLEGICSELREIENIDLALLFREINACEIRVNIRSNENFNSADLARCFGGGGHARAAGITMKNGGGLSEVMTLITHKAFELMKMASSKRKAKVRRL